MTIASLPYFRFTHHSTWDWVLDAWLSHFEKLEIPAAIVRDGNSYSVWRCGEEEGFTKNNELLVGEVMRIVNGFMV